MLMLLLVCFFLYLPSIKLIQIAKFNLIYRYEVSISNMIRTNNIDDKSNGPSILSSPDSSMKTQKAIFFMKNKKARANLYAYQDPLSNIFLTNLSSPEE